MNSQNISVFLYSKLNNISGVYACQYLFMSYEVHFLSKTDKISVYGLLVQTGDANIASAG